MIAIDDPTRGLVIRAATSRERLYARLRAGWLDRQLAAGTAPETSPLHRAPIFLESIRQVPFIISLE